MNKQVTKKGFTDEQIKEMNSKAIGYRIIKLPQYPTDGRFIEARLDFNIGMIVVWNVDSYILKHDKNTNKSIMTSNNIWTVLASSNAMFKYNLEFDDLEDAIQWAYLCYERYVEGVYKIESDKINKVLNERRWWDEW